MAEEDAQVYSNSVWLKRIGVNQVFVVMALLLMPPANAIGRAARTRARTHPNCNEGRRSFLTNTLTHVPA